MNPGRELDALVAERVFGAKRPLSKEEALRLLNDAPKTKPIADVVQVVTELMDTWFFPDVGRKELPAYSASIGAAWEVVEKLRDDNFSLEEHGTHWKARFGTEWAGAETAPHAICLAALRATGWEG